MIRINDRDASSLDLTKPSDKNLIIVIYETLWRAMERENNLINQRMTWPITLSSAFIIAESFLARPIFDQIASGKPNLSSLAPCLLNIFISALGIEFSFKARKSVYAAITQLRRLRIYYESCTFDGKPLFENALFLPQPHGDSALHIAGTTAAEVFPSALFRSWCILAASHGVALVTLIVMILHEDFVSR